ncbi:MAG: malic enzyme-like NAD(P)-binding protein, partial [bacterium]
VTDALALPGLFRGVIETGASRFTTSMMLEAARAIAEVVPDEDLRPRFILPDLLDLNVGPNVARAASRCAIEENLSRGISVTPEEVAARTRQYIYEGDPIDDDPDFWEKIDEPVENDLGLRYYRNHRGPLTLRSKIALKDREILGLLYIPGLGEVVKTIREQPERSYELSCRGNLVAVATNGSAVLGLGDIGVPAAGPVMEGKSVIFKTFAGVEAFPLCLEDDGDPEQFIESIKRLEPSLGGVNLEDITAPDCFEIERRLKDEMDIPIFHDDQHGTAVVILAGLKNALQYCGRSLEDVQIVINGAGASALATARILKQAGASRITICDSKGPIYSGRGNLNPEKRRVAEWTNPDGIQGELSDALPGADVFIGLSVAEVLSKKDVQTMADDPIIFALANPVPEILPPEAREGGASIVATGRSDYSNQVNNAIAFPGIFRGALDVRATEITEGMKIAASEALAGLVRAHGIREHYILPRAMDFRTAPKVAEAVAQTAIDEGVARRDVDPSTILEHTKDYIYEGRLYYLP